MLAFGAAQGTGLPAFRGGIERTEMPCLFAALALSISLRLPAAQLELPRRPRAIVLVNTAYCADGNFLAVTGVYAARRKNLVRARRCRVAIVCVLRNSRIGMTRHSIYVRNRRWQHVVKRIFGCKRNICLLRLHSRCRCHTAILSTVPPDKSVKICTHPPPILRGNVSWN